MPRVKQRKNRGRPKAAPCFYAVFVGEPTIRFAAFSEKNVMKGPNPTAHTSVPGPIKPPKAKAIRVHRQSVTIRHPK